MRRGVIMIIILASIVGAWFVVRDRSSSNESTNLQEAGDSAGAGKLPNSGGESDKEDAPKGKRIEERQGVDTEVCLESRVTKLLAKKTSKFSRSIEIVVDYSDGAPAAGMWIYTRGGHVHDTCAPKRLDASGSVLLQRVDKEPMRVVLTTEKFSYGGNVIAVVEDAEGDWLVEATVLRPHEVLFHVSLDGVPGVPPDMEMQRGFGYLRDECPVEVLDPVNGVVRAFWRPTELGEVRTVALIANGWVLDAPKGVIELKDTGSKLEKRNINFVRGGTIELHVVAHACERPIVKLQRWASSSLAWETDRSWTWCAAYSKEERRASLDSLPAGRYRFASSAGGHVSKEVNVRGGETTRLVFDLRYETGSTGHVDVPDGVDPKEVYVQVMGSSFPDSFGVDSHGRPRICVSDAYSFHIKASGTEDLTLIPVHPRLVPAGVGGSAKLRRARDDIVLKMVPGPLVVAKFSPVPISTNTRKSQSLLAFKGAVTAGSHARTIPIVVVDGALTCRSLPQGTWTLWADVHGYVPVTIKDVVVTESGLDLGTVRLTKGSTFRVRYKVREGFTPPSSHVWLRPLQGPHHIRAAAGEGGLVEVTGLAQGKYRAGVRRDYGNTFMLSSESDLGVIEFDGKSTVEKTIDLR